MPISLTKTKMTTKGKVSIGIIATIAIGALVVFATQFGGENFTGNMFSSRTAPIRSKIDTVKIDTPVEIAKIDTVKIDPPVEIAKIDTVKIDTPVEIAKIDTPTTLISKTIEKEYYENCKRDRSIFKTDQESMYTNFSDFYKNIEIDSTGNLPCQLRFVTFSTADNGRVMLTCNKIMKSHDLTDDTYSLECIDSENNTIQTLTYSPEKNELHSILSFGKFYGENNRMSVSSGLVNPRLWVTESGLELN